MKETFNIYELSRNELIDFIDKRLHPEIERLNKKLDLRREHVNTAIDLLEENDRLTKRNTVLYNLNRNLIGVGVSEYMRNKFRDEARSQAQQASMPWNDITVKPIVDQESFVRGAEWLMENLYLVKTKEQE